MKREYNKQLPTYLVQRVMHRTMVREDDTGVDRYFAMDYMGSAEFEWGALPSALKDMREAKLVKKPIKIKVNGNVCWYMGPKNGLEEATDFFTDQLNDDYAMCTWRLKERSCISESYAKQEEGTYRGRTIGWWSIRNNHARYMKNLPWIIFKIKEDAIIWRKCVS